MGDGGVTLQVQSAEGEVVSVSDQSWQCLVVHRAPLNKSCAKEDTPVAGVGNCEFLITEVPDGWDTADFDASAWPQAVQHSESAVRPKDGYDRITWDSSAQLIWGEDLEIDNTVLCRVLVQ